MAALSPLASDGVIFHLAGYGVTNLAAFLCVIIFYNATNREDIAGFAGLADRAPYLAMAFTVALFSLAGLPFFAGFTTKFYLFTAAAEGGLLWLVGLAIVNSLISLYYYLMVIKQMYMVPAGENAPVKVSLVERRSPGAAGAWDHRPGRLSRPSGGRDTGGHGRDTAVAIPGLCWQ